MKFLTTYCFVFKFPEAAANRRNIQLYVNNHLIFLFQCTASQTSTFLINYFDLPSRKDFNFPVKIKFVLRKCCSFWIWQGNWSTKINKVQLGNMNLVKLKFHKENRDRPQPIHLKAGSNRQIELYLGQKTMFFLLEDSKLWKYHLRKRKHIGSHYDPLWYLWRFLNDRRDWFVPCTQHFPGAKPWYFHPMMLSRISYRWKLLQHRWNITSWLFISNNNLFYR